MNLNYNEAFFSFYINSNASLSRAKNVQYYGILRNETWNFKTFLKTAVNIIMLLLLTDPIHSFSMLLHLYQKIKVQDF
jgi:hypothetical protein